MTEEWICEKLKNLKIEENCLTTLTEIRERLDETPNLDAKVTKHLLSTPEIYRCLEEDRIKAAANNVDPIEIVCDILCKCLNNMTFKDNSDLPTLLHRALMHKQMRIRAAVLGALLKELYKDFVSDHDDERDATPAISMELLNYILLAVQEEETEVGTPAYHILCMVIKPYVEEPSVRQSLLEGLKKSDVVKCRLYELAVNLGMRSAATLAKVEFILDHALSELDNDDVLVQANILEILVTLAESNHSLTYLEKRQVFEVLSKRIEEMEHNPLDRLLIPGIMKFFGKISSVQPQKIIDGYPHMIQSLVKGFESGDHSMLPVAFDTLVNLTHTEHGIYLLEKNYATSMKELFENYANNMKNLPIALRIRALESLNHIFTFDKEVVEDVSVILQRWYSYLSCGTNNMQVLMLFCRMPFSELRYASLNLIRSLCSYAWGIEALKNTAGFVEFLLDRSVGFEETAKYVKYSIIVRLADSEIFDIQTSCLLRSYVAEGPFLVQREADVAVDENQ